MKCPELRTINSSIPLKDFEQNMKIRDIDFEYRILEKTTNTNKHSEKFIKDRKNAIGKNRV